MEKFSFPMYFILRLVSPFSIREFRSDFPDLYRAVCAGVLSDEIDKSINFPDSSKFLNVRNVLYTASVDEYIQCVIFNHVK